MKHGNTATSAGKSFLSSVSASATAALLLAASPAAFADGFEAGFARVDATPPPGLPMPGYFSHRVANGVLDPLRIDCVAVSDGENRALIYCVDDLHLTNPFFEKAFPAITEATGVPRDRIYVHSTHTHTGAADWPRPGYTDEENNLIREFAAVRIAKLAEVVKPSRVRHEARPERQQFHRLRHGIGRRAGDVAHDGGVLPGECVYER